MFHRRTHSRLFALFVVLALVLLGLPTTPAQAAINTTVTALDLANAMFINMSVITGASFVNRAGADGTNSSAAVVDDALASFPQSGPTYAVLSSGRTDQIGPTGDNQPGLELAGTYPARGNTAYDVTILKIDLNVPSGSNCLTVGRFRFLSAEYPEYVGQQYNDAFIAELDVND